jgi:hypothetical protein
LTGRLSNLVLTEGTFSHFFPKELKVVFALHNLEYEGRDLFREVDEILVPSHAAQEHYRRKVGVGNTVLPGPWTRPIDENPKAVFRPLPVTGTSAKLPLPTFGRLAEVRIAITVNK